MSDRLHAWTRGWLVLVFLVLDVFFAGFLLPLIGGLMQGGQGGLVPLDLMAFAEPNELFAMIEKYGESTRMFYRNVEMTVDIVYPIVYLFFFGFLISWLAQRGFSPTSPLRKCNIIPVVMWFFDLLENIVIVILVSVYPSKPAALGWLLVMFGSGKWLAFGATLLMTLVSLVMATKNRFKIQRESGTS